MAQQVPFGLPRYLRAPNPQDPAGFTELDLMNLQEPQPLPQFPQHELPPMPPPPETADPALMETPIPQAMRQEAERQKYQSAFERAAAQEEQGLENLDRYIRDYAQRPTQTDYTALAGFADYLAPGGMAMQVAKATRPFTQDEKEQKLLQLQDLLQRRRSEFTGRLNDPLKGQLALTRLGLQSQANDIRKMYYDAMLGKFGAQQTEGFGKEVGAPAQSLAGALGAVEQKLGFSLDAYDPKTNSVGGKTVDLPGVSVPGYGRLEAYSEAAQGLRSAIASVFNVELKDRSGAAVTNPEMQRLKQEFGEGKFNTEPQMLEAIQRYKGLAVAELAQREAGYTAGVRGRYREQGGKTVEDLFKNVPRGIPPAPKGYVNMSDGNETLQVLESDVNDALKAGFKRVGK